MAANTSPIYPLTPNNGSLNAILSTAMTNTKALDGTEAAGTALVLVFTADANGARLDDLFARLTSANGATASGTTAATLIRFWINNGSVNTTAGNNRLQPWDIAIPATAVVALDTAPQPVYTIRTDLSLRAGYRVYAGTTIAIGGTNCAVLVGANGGDY